MTSPLVLQAPAKLNLWLHLTGERRTDGRHELLSHFAPLTLADSLTLRPAPEFSLSLSGPFSMGVPLNEANLVWRAFDKFCQDFGSADPLHIHIEKNIPHGAGLGGGSSDAGALLAHLAKARGLSIPQVQAWSLCLGADIPAAIAPKSQLVSGVGDVLGKSLSVPNTEILLIKPPQSCPTGSVFDALQTCKESDNQEQDRNDLETAAISICPEIEMALAGLKTLVDPCARMTGSGSACFGFIHHDRETPQRLLEELPDFWIKRTGFAV